MHQQGGTIENALDSIASHEYVLPAIQREFVWQPEQVCNLFDSLMQGYPFGEFMLWRVASEEFRQVPLVRFRPQVPPTRQPPLPGIAADPRQGPDGGVGWSTAIDCLQHRTARFDGPEAPLQVVEQLGRLP